MIDGYASFFKEITSYCPYPYQEKVFSLLDRGKSVVLRAPTGTGKTLSVIMPYLYLRKNNEKMADRIIYALPMRALAFDLYNSTIQIAEKAGFCVVEDPEKRSGEDRDSEICITIQTGELQNDHFFEGDIIFTTIDQLLSGYLTLPVSLPDRLGNINIGAIIGSLIVFDEVHLMEFQRSFLTATEMMNRFEGLVQFFVMTATLTEPTQKWLAKQIKAEPITCSINELKSVPGYEKRSRVYSFENSPISSDAVIKNHRQKTLVICNRVDKAQQIYSELKEKLINADTKIALLHSRFFKRDRSEIEKNLQLWFGKRSEDVNAILVSTQVVEAGIDISCNTMHTELAPANSLIQRAGRCARYSGTGNVFIHEIEDPSNPLPYPKNEVDATRKEIKNFREKELDPDFEKDLVERVHAPLEDSRLIDSLQNRRGEVNEAMDHGHSSSIQKLIREVDSVNIILTPNPHSENLEISWPEMLSVPRSTLYKLKKKGTDDWIFKIPIFSDDEEFKGVKWEKVESVRDISWLVALNPKFARYSQEVGLIFGEEGTRCIILNKKSPYKSYKYSCESFQEHTHRVIAEARSLIPLSDKGIMKLSKKMRLDRNHSIEKMILLACALHDTGKLSVRWQGAMNRWQGISNPNAEQFIKGLPLAHTTYDPVKDWIRMQELKIQKGPHAAEGAYAVFTMIFKGSQTMLGDGDDTQNMALGIMAAIARHHGPRTSNLQPFELIPQAKNILNDAMKTLEIDLGDMEISETPNKDVIDSFRQYLKISEIDNGIFLYWLSVRIIRLADQRATSKIGA
ncbi:CRISPR-associated helicase Cas3' [Methanothrix sp.]